MDQTDNKLVSDVVDQLKKQGVFDQLRKECLIDVDVTAAYQNLTRRVQNLAEMFLKTQKWRTDINKNHLRESLRRNLLDSHLLSGGVDRVVEQIISPEIVNNFKPKIDKVICEKLGLDYDQWLAKQNEPRVKRVVQRVPRLLDLQMPGQMQRPRMGENLNIVPPDISMLNSNGLVPPLPGHPSAMLNHLPPMHVPPPNMNELPPPPPHSMGVGVGGMGGGFHPPGLGYGMPSMPPQYDYETPDRGGYFPSQYPINAPGYPSSMTSFPPMDLHGMGNYSEGLVPAALVGFEMPLLPPYPNPNDVSDSVVVETLAVYGKKKRKKKKVPTATLS